ncbi:uncharacterized protein ACLA_048650 [Aspergillus clavatus NRRL 1]|uniref:Uncharacterized protein n=1 Tax=Aspergillus clavatus (strain ATCC 1007 / CBS 513.65 / DSM 816 / NCTC 3887 / NRRL 1 / QM 1276 / 107) TaxID=344612 RepID=A1CHN8_ASPCL|nr:uncharacterized protein ACLA_048650 [Aspergillus clavatus NRRL 1]EAW10393.1 hypothetical protein ACLA_048650 [Aspergillus clavatus NRRL 1]
MKWLLDKVNHNNIPFKGFNKAGELYEHFGSDYIDQHPKGTGGGPRTLRGLLICSLPPRKKRREHSVYGDR